MKSPECMRKEALIHWGDASKIPGTDEYMISQQTIHSPYDALRGALNNVSGKH